MPGGFKNEERLRRTLDKWSRLKRSYRLVHSMSYNYRNGSPLLENRAEDIFKTWDVISTSLVDIDKISNKWKDCGWGERSRVSGIYFELAFVLEVQPQNILGTHAHDVWFPNHAGCNRGNSWALADAIFSGRGKPGGEKKWPSVKGHGYNKIISPEKLLRESRAYHHNEILIIGKPNIRLYAGLPATCAPKVKEIIFVPQRCGNGVSDYNSCKKPFHDQVRRVNPGVKFTIL